MNSIRRKKTMMNSNNMNQSQKSDAIGKLRSITVDKDTLWKALAELAGRNQDAVKLGGSD